jgi:hypothetical protein
MAVFASSMLLSWNAASAAVINVNVTNGSAAQSTVANPGYGLWSQGGNSWNLATTSGTNLVDSAGNITTIGFNTVSFGSSNSNSGWGPDGLTNNGRYGPTDNTTIHQANITGLIPNQAYALLVYHAANNAVETQSANTLSPQDFTGSTTTANSATYVDGFGTSGANTHFYYYSSVTASSGGVIQILSSGINYETFTGFQIQPVPETSSSILLGMGALAAAFVRRR